MSESDLEKKIGVYCKKRYILYYKFTSPSRRSVPDRILLGPQGRVMFMEIKAPGKAATKLQLHEQKKLKELGFAAVVIDNYEDAVSCINWYFSLHK